MGESEREENPLMRANEVIRILGIGRNTFYDLCRRKIIPHKKVGRQIFVPRKRFWEWLDAGEDKEVV